MSQKTSAQVLFDAEVNDFVDFLLLAVKSLMTGRRRQLESGGDYR